MKGGIFVKFSERISRLKIRDLHMKEVVRGATIAFTLRVLGAGLGFLFNIVLARLFGAQGAGVYYLAFTMTSIASVVSRVGLDNAVLRFTASNASQGRWEKIADLYRTGTLIAVGTSASITMLVLLSAPWISRVVFSEPTLTGPLRLMTFAILPFSLLTLQGEFLKGLKKIRDATLIQGLGVPLISLLLLVLIGDSLGLEGATVAYMLATILVLVGSIVLWRMAMPRLNGMRESFDTRLLVRTSLPLFWASSLTLVMTWTDTIMLGIWTDSVVVGIYGVAIRTALLTSFVLVAVNSILAPKIAVLSTQRDTEALLGLARNTAKFSVLISAPALLAFVFAPQWILGLFGSGFETGASSLTILAVGQFVNVAAGSVGPLLMMSGNERSLRTSVIVAAILNLLLNSILIPTVGMIGAAVSTSFSVVLLNAMCLMAVRKHLRTP